MTKPRIEEKKGRKIGEDEYTEHWSLDGHSYIQVPKWVIIQTHQAGVRDALVLIDKYDPIKIGERVNLPFYWGNELRQALNDTIKALQDNK